MTGPNRIAWLSPADSADAFPPVERALRDPDGLLAAGGDLSSDRLLYAYRHGIFPWYEDGQPILWWSPDPRCILRPDSMHVSRRLRRAIRQSDATVHVNTAFAEVMRACAAPREGQPGTWITPEMMAAYEQLHQSGWAHSIEIRHDGQLVGGLYGVAIGRAFFGESMFSRHSNASKFALLALCRGLHDPAFEVIDCQVVSPHLTSLGAELVERRRFAGMLDECCEPRLPCRNWTDVVIPVRELALANDALQ